MAHSAFALPLSLLSYLALFPSVAYGATQPIVATWSPNTYGPDGPWPAVEVIMGSTQKIALYPGREYASFLLTSDYCTYNSTMPCYASQAGLYNSAQSALDKTGSTGLIQYAPPADFMMGLPIKGAKAKSWVDNINLQSGSTIANTSMALVGKSFVEYPDGSWYPLSVGCLGVGAPETVNQSFATGSSSPNINASLVPGYMWAKQTIASNSFAMHIGSANPKMSGSLYFGGYDQNRLLGDIITGSGDYNRELTLKDIAIQVIDGSSPWSFGASKTGLLSQGNSSISSGGLQVHVDGCSPYLSLPRSTCDAIAAQLPVTYNANLGLYIWNTNDPKYSQIVSSASALEFQFLGFTNTQKVSIKVPFRHLNLTLDAPLVSQKQQYFPCFTGASGNYVLGRAFLQDAFVGANWGSKTWWLGQAPGPNVPNPEVIEIADGDKTIQASTNDWKESWTGSWKALTPAEVSGSAVVSVPSATASSSDLPTSTPSAGGLSTGAQAGIGAGAGIIGLALIGGLVFFLFRRRKTDSKADTLAHSSFEKGTANSTTNGPHNGYYAPVKNPTTPAMSDSGATGSYASPSMTYASPQGGYPQQGYPQQGYPQQGYAQQGYASQYPQYQQHLPTSPQELPAHGNTPQELPTSVYHHPGSPEAELATATSDGYGQGGQHIPR